MILLADKSNWERGTRKRRVGRRRKDFFRRREGPKGGASVPARRGRCDYSSKRRNPVTRLFLASIAACTRTAPSLQFLRSFSSRNSVRSWGPFLARSPSEFYSRESLDWQNSTREILFAKFASQGLRSRFFSQVLFRADDAVPELYLISSDIVFSRSRCRLSLLRFLASLNKINFNTLLGIRPSLCSALVIVIDSGRGTKPPVSLPL